MSLHRSLKTKPAGLAQHRNVLTRAERITKLTETEKFDPNSKSPLGLVKVANRMAAPAKKEKKAAEGEAGTEGAAAPAAGAGAAPAAKAAAPAAKPAGKK